jgi:hypothetical protein
MNSHVRKSSLEGWRCLQKHERPLWCSVFIRTEFFFKISCHKKLGPESRAEILKQSMGARNRVRMELSHRPARAQIFMEPKNQFQGINSAILRSLANRYDNPIPT